MQNNYEAGKVEMAEMYKSQVDGLKGQINDLQNRPVEVHNHYHNDGGCTIL